MSKYFQEGDTLMGFAETFKAQSDPTRREILTLLRNGPLTAGEIVEQFEMTGASISHHLSILKHAGVIDDEKKGKFIYYYLNSSVLDDVLNWLLCLKGDPSAEAAEMSKPIDKKGKNLNEK